MARIQTYNIDSLIEGSDKLVGTDGTIGPDLNKTKNFTVGDLATYMIDQLGNEVVTISTAQTITGAKTFTTDLIADSIIKAGGGSDQFLMANGLTSTMPTLQQVTTAGGMITNTITITAPGDDALTISAGSGTGIYSDAPDGTAIYASSDFGIALQGSSTENYGVYAYTLDGSAIQAEVGAGGEGGAIIADGGTTGAGIGVLNGGLGIMGATGPVTGFQLKLSLDSASKPSTGTWTVASDSRVKTNINPYTKGLETILAINPITYDYNGKAGFDPAITGNIGIIAQDVLNIIPESINTYHAKLNEEDEEKTELYNFDSHALTFILINAVKQLSAEIELLKST